MGLFAVEITVVAMIVADDEDDAIAIAEGDRSEILMDTEFPHISVLKAISRRDDLIDGWDGNCIPYGGDGNTRIRDIIGDERA